MPIFPPAIVPLIGNIHRRSAFCFWFGVAEENANAWNGIDHYCDTTADRRAAELGLFKGMGLLPRRRARYHSDHRYYFGPDGTHIASANEWVKGQDLLLLPF
jgi:hypothetical protein